MGLWSIYLHAWLIFYGTSTCKYTLVNWHGKGNPPFFLRRLRYIFKWWISHCSVRLPERKWTSPIGPGRWISLKQDTFRPIRTPRHNAQHVDPLQTAAYQTSNERCSGSGERKIFCFSSRAKIRRLPVEVGSLSHYLRGFIMFYTSQVVSQISSIDSSIWITSNNWFTTMYLSSSFNSSFGPWKSDLFQGFRMA